MAALLDHPAKLAAAVRALLDDYADRAHRPSPRVATSAVENSYKVPAPVLRAVVTALREPARANPTALLEALPAVWAGGSREERLLAAELLGHVAAAVPLESVLALVESWVPQIETGATADALAEHGLGQLVRANPASFLDRARNWATQPRRLTRRFAVALLLPLISDRHWDNVPGALGVLRPVMTEADGEVRRAAADALARLATKSPVEIAHFLREQAGRPNTHTRWIVRNALGTLDAEAQAEIIKILRG